MSNAASLLGVPDDTVDPTDAPALVAVDTHRRALLAQAGQANHVVQFYEDDEFLADTVAHFLGAGLGAGEPIVAIATDAHRDAFCCRLRATGFDVDRVRRAGLLTMLDARETLAQFMLDDVPDPALFNAVVGGAVARSAARHPRAHVRAFGEMVDLLWGDGNHDGALRLEALWNELGSVHSFLLLCGYKMSHFHSEADGQRFAHVCQAHTQVFPTERYSELAGTDARLREIGLLQQRARALENEVRARKQAEESLRFLLDASKVLGSSLDYETTLPALARLCVPRLADCVLIDLELDDATFRRLAVAHADPKRIDVFEDLWHRVVALPEDRHGVAEVLRTAKPEVIGEITESFLVEAFADPSTREVVRHLGLRAFMCVPLCIGDDPIGAITFFRTTSAVTPVASAAFGEGDLRMAQELARRASTAIEHAKVYEDARSANRLKDEFLATVSHELRTPLNAILGWARMLRTGTISLDKMPRALETIERNTQVQAHLVEDLLDVSRIISGKMRLEMQPVDMPLMVEAAIDSVRPAMDAKGIRFHAVVDASAGPVSGDAQRLQQVLWNLLSNAIKFTPKGGEVQLVLERVDANAEITVIDRGQGIPKHLLATIFDRFKQADGSTTRVHGGLGLGLAISRHIVDLHGGSIEVASEGEGRGATFVVRLPVATPTQPTRGPFYVPMSAAQRNAPFERPRELQGLTVLIVDDEPGTREVLAELLTQCGCAVLSAASSEEALAVLDGASPKLLVCDIGMPGTDGYAFIEKVRRRPADKGGKVLAVALTAYATGEDRRRALRAGYQMHVSKPVEPAELVAVLANLAELAIARA